MKKFLAFFLIAIMSFAYAENSDYALYKTKNINSNINIIRQDYNRAEILFSEGKYSEAINIYTSLHGYQDSKERIKQAKEKIAEHEQKEKELASYAKGLEYLKSGKMNEARQAFIESGDCKDSTYQIYNINKLLSQESYYQRAKSLYQSEKYREAYDIFSNIPAYKDSAMYATNAHNYYMSRLYTWAKSKGDTAIAYITFKYLKDFQDSSELADNISVDDETIYNYGEILSENEKYELARAAYSSIVYKDAKQKARELSDIIEKEEKLKKAKILADIWDVGKAREILSSLSDYGDANIILSGLRIFSAKELRDYCKSKKSEIYIAKDGTKHQYQIFKGVRLWREAERFCKAQGGHLATISDEYENAFVHDYMISTGHKEAYIGLSDEHRTGDWVWVTGEKFAYSNWSEKEPSRCAKERYAMYFTTLQKPRTWNDSHFYEHQEHDPGCSFICEWKK